MSDPWTDQPTPLTDALCPLSDEACKEDCGYEYAIMVINSRALEQRMRAAEALLKRCDTPYSKEELDELEIDLREHFAAAQAMDAGERDGSEAGNRRGENMSIINKIRQAVSRTLEPLVRLFGLPGSWAWACRQMERGAVVRPRSATGAVRYKLDNEGHRRLVWAFQRDPAEYRWENANFFLSDQESTDWEVVEPNTQPQGRGLPRRLERIVSQ